MSSDLISRDLAAHVLAASTVMVHISKIWAIFFQRSQRFSTLSMARVAVPPKLPQTASRRMHIDQLHWHQSNRLHDDECSAPQVDRSVQGAGGRARSPTPWGGTSQETPSIWPTTYLRPRTRHTGCWTAADPVAVLGHNAPGESFLPEGASAWVDENRVGL